MSIINDALKKAEREGIPKPPLTSFPKRKRTLQNRQPRAKNLPPLIGIIGVILVLFLLYNLFPKKTAVDRKSLLAPKSPARQANTLTGTRTIKVKEGLSLSGIVFSEAESWAVINDTIVSEGDTIKGAKLLKIEEKSVELAFPDKKLILSLEE